MLSDSSLNSKLRELCCTRLMLLFGRQRSWKADCTFYATFNIDSATWAELTFVWPLQCRVVAFPERHPKHQQAGVMLRPRLVQMGLPRCMRPYTAGVCVCQLHDETVCAPMRWQHTCICMHDILAANPTPLPQKGF